MIHMRRRPVPGQNIRRAGSDIRAGQIVLDKGRRLGPREIAACAAAGAGVVRVHPRLRVALLVTGDEVRRAGGARSAAQIWDVNTPMLAAALGGASVDLVAAEHGADTPIGLAGQLGALAAQADLVITTGGVSAGEEDHVKPAFAALGGVLVFSGVAIKPGKPVSFGRIGATCWLGLPGNPLSAFVTWQVFGTALVRGLSGATLRAPGRRHVVTGTEIRRKPGRCELRPATLDGFDGLGREVARFEDATHSGRVATLPQADGLILLPAGTRICPRARWSSSSPFAGTGGRTHETCLHDGPGARRYRPCASGAGSRADRSGPALLRHRPDQHRAPG
jgi:molybdopterin molybdotransferase